MTRDPPRPPPVLLARRDRLFVLATWCVLGLLESGKAWVQGRFTGRPPDWATVLVGNMPWWLAWAVITPLVIAFARRVRPGDGPFTFMGLHLIAAVVVSLAHHAAVGSLYFYTHTRGGLLGTSAGLVDATLGLQFRIFFYGYFILNLVTYAAVIAAYYGFEFHARHREGELRSARLEAGMHRARLAALRMELNPHFLFNTLNAIAGLVRGHANAEAVRMLARLADLLRATLEHASDPEVPLDKEMELLSTYLGIEAIRFGDRLDVRIHTDEGARAALVPPLILQPLVENAVKHGIARHSGAGRIEIHAAARGEELVLEVTNTGPEDAGTTRPSAGPRAGIGVTNTRQRLAEMYGARAGLRLDPLPGGGARATITMPFHTGLDADASAPAGVHVTPAAQAP